MTPARDHLREAFWALVYVLVAWLVFRRVTMRVF